MKWCQVVLDDHVAHARKQGVVHPATLSVPVLNAAPMAVFRSDFQRHVAPLEHPIDPMAERRSAPDVALLGLQ